MSARIPVDAIEQIREELLHLGGLPVEDVGPIECSEDVNSDKPLALVAFMGRYPVYLLDELPFDPKRIASRMRDYLYQRPGIHGQRMVFEGDLDDFDGSAYRMTIEVLP